MLVLPAALALSAGLTTAPPARIFIDGGHGAPNNTGTVDAECRAESIYTKSAQDEVARALEKHADVLVKRGRPDDKEVRYRDRIRAMATFRATAAISIHSDARAADRWWRDATTGCLRSSGGNGFAVLYSDEGSESLVTKRRALAEALAEELVAEGFTPYDGADYPGLYHPVAAGVFVDRHAPSKRIMMLRRTTVPYVILETHQAIDEREHMLWTSPATQQRLADAVYRAVITLK